MSKPSRQQEIILSHLRGGNWVCGSVWLNEIKDDRARISSLNSGYMREKGYEIVGTPCDGRCGKKHPSRLFMRKAERLVKKSTAELCVESVRWFEALPA